MPQARIWTADADAAIKTLRLAGQTWAVTGRSLGLSRNTVIERGRRLRADAPLRKIEPPAVKAISDDPNRDPLPAGHPLTWGLLTQAEYPDPAARSFGSERFTSHQG